MTKLNTGHFLMGVRLDNWLQLLKDDHFHIDPQRLPQAGLITATALATAPAALAEKLIYGKNDRLSDPEKDPIFILGHWRSGTTYLQNMMSRDPQFGWADPVNTVLHPFSRILGKMLIPSVEEGLRGGRPMDNVQYDLSLPMEETFALLTFSRQSIIHLIAFPERYAEFTEKPFVQDLPLEDLWQWRRDYRKVIQKLTAVNGGKQLLLKSPDNTGHVAELRALYPDARFVNIHRDPYKTIRSTVNMFLVETEALRLTAVPENFEELVEDTVVEIFRRMYEQLFALEPELPQNRYISFAYKDFCAAPVDTLQKVYSQLELEGFERAKFYFQQYADSQKNYKKNQFEVSDRLKDKINAKLGFYFDRYGYEMLP